MPNNQRSRKEKQHSNLIYLAALVGKMYAKYNKDRADDNQRKANETALVKATKQAACATIIIAIAALLTLGAAIVQAIIFNRQFGAMKSTDDHIAKQLSVMEEQARPWVVVSAINVLQKVDLAKPRFLMNFVLKNISQRPAYVLARGDVIASTMDDWRYPDTWNPKWRALQDSQCFMDFPKESAAVVVPQDPMDYPDGSLRVASPNMEAVRRNGGEYLVTVVGCIQYKSRLSQDRPYQTKFGGVLSAEQCTSNKSERQPGEWVHLRPAMGVVAGSDLCVRDIHINGAE